MNSPGGILRPSEDDSDKALVRFEDQNTTAAEDDSADQPRYLSPKEFAAACGASISTINRYLRDGKLPYAQPNGEYGRRFIPRDALEAHMVGNELKDQSTKASDESSEETAQGARLAGPSPQWMRDAPCNQRGNSQADTLNLGDN